MMSSAEKPVTIDQKSNTVTVSDDARSRPDPSTASNTGSSSKSNIKDSAANIVNIASRYHLGEEISSTSSGMDISKRIVAREKLQQERRQRNLEKIVAFAHASCRDEAASNPDDDWLNRFFEMAQDIGNPSMQRLWAQVLKREVINPGSTSIKSLKLLKDLSAKEAQIIQRGASLASAFGNDGANKLIIGYRGKASLFKLGRSADSTTLNLGGFQLPYSSLLLLIELGVIIGTELESGEIESDPAVVVSYQGKHLALEPHTKGLRLVYYRFSPVGNELCRLLGNKPNMKYHDQLLALLNQKFTITSEVKGSVSTSA
jgi:uncharacterized repeat protein (TIGR03899 family)